MGDLVAFNLQVVLHLAHILRLLLDLGRLHLCVLRQQTNFLPKLPNLLISGLRFLILLLQLCLELQYKLTALLQGSLILTTLTLLGVSHELQLPHLCLLLVQFTGGFTQLQGHIVVLLLQLIQLLLQFFAFVFASVELG